MSSKKKLIQHQEPLPLQKHTPSILFYILHGTLTSNTPEGL